MNHYIGIDIGGTNIVCGILNTDGQLVMKQKQPTEAHLGSEAIFNRINRMIESLLADTGMDRSSIMAIGVGTPGFVDPVQGITLNSTNLQWVQVSVASELERRTSIPVFIDNDVKMYVYGEAIYGAGRGYDHVLGITIGTGLAAAMVNKGQIYYGGGFLAGELGHISLDEITYECGCGNTGCLETAVSANGMVRQAKEMLAAGRSSIVQEWLQGEESLTSVHLSRAYDAGDSLAIEVMNRTGRLLGKALSYAVTMFSSDIIVIGGGAAQAGERLFHSMREELRLRLNSNYRDRLTIATAQHLDDAGIIGSAMMAKQRKAEHE